MEAPSKSAAVRILSSFLRLLRGILASVLLLLLPPSSPKTPPSPPPSLPQHRIHGEFRAFDRNGDGKITAKELADTLLNLGIYIAPGDLATAIAEVDADGDGCVDEAEFDQLYRKLVEEDGEEGEEKMVEVFGMFDKNGDGYITAEELRLVLGALGMERGKEVEECRRMIGRFDADGDGRVDFEEFKDMMKGVGGSNLNADQGWRVYDSEIDFRN